MSEPLVLAIPSKGRLKDQTESWLVDCGLALQPVGGARGYRAGLQRLDDVEVRLASAADIAAALVAGDIQLGITGEDLLGEFGAGESRNVLFLAALEFGRADLVVAAPRSWIDVETMADLDEVAHLHLSRTGRRLRVATKYPTQARAFFARHGLADCRMVDSGGATEGAPATGAAEVVVDITTSGATLAANGLKVLADGLILKSQARLGASLSAAWDEERLAICRRLLGIVEARARGKSVASLAWPSGQDDAARAALAPWAKVGESTIASGVLVAQDDIFAAVQALNEADVGPVTVTHLTYVFDPASPAAARLIKALGA